MNKTSKKYLQKLPVNVSWKRMLILLVSLLVSLVLHYAILNHLNLQYLPYICIQMIGRILKNIIWEMLGAEIKACLPKRWHSFKVIFPAIWEILGTLLLDDFGHDKISNREG